MTWQLLLAINIIFYSISALMQRVLLKESFSRPISYAILFPLFCGVMIGAYGLASGQLVVSSLAALQPLWLNLVLMVVFYGLGNVFIFRALQKLEVANFTVLFATRAFFTIVTASVLLKESLTLAQFLGACAIFLGVLLVNHSTFPLRFKPGSFLALLAAVCFGLANTNDRFLLGEMELYFFLVIAFILPSLFLMMLYRHELPYIKEFLEPRKLRNLLILCVFYSVSAICFFKALQIAPNASQVASINLSSVIMIVILSIIVLKEKDHMAWKVAAAVVTFGGLLLLN